MNPVFCRMCLKDPPVDSLVFSVYDTFQGRPLVELIDELFSIKVIVEDRLLNVCLECVNKIHSVQKISRLFVTNNDKLQNMLHGEETEAIGIDEETESVGYEEMHSDETSTGGQNPHRQPNGRGETEEVLLTIERNTQEIEELYLDTDAKCRIARRVEEVNDKLPTDERVNQKRQLSVKQSELNRC
uniref:Uncharacterized protein n=1 Tax=Anopheles darlingi TaxID=43151 RepID=A0A675B363_ANODA